jgi:hypothetical protein
LLEARVRRFPQVWEDGHAAARDRRFYGVGERRRRGSDLREWRRLGQGDSGALVANRIRACRPGRFQHLPVRKLGCRLPGFNSRPLPPADRPGHAELRPLGSQATIVATLQSFAVQPGFNPLQPMANAQSLAVPKKFVAAGDYSDYWFPDAANPSNVELGVHLRYMKQNAKPELYQMTYTVDGSEGHFTVLWNRVLRTPPPR